jgi:hypothetical protein
MHESGGEVMPMKFFHVEQEPLFARQDLLGLGMM